MPKPKGQKRRNRQKSGGDDSVDDEFQDVEVDGGTLAANSRHRHTYLASYVDEVTTVDAKTAKSQRKEELKDPEPLVPKSARCTKSLPLYTAYVNTLEELKNFDTLDKRRKIGLAFLRHWQRCSYKAVQPERHRIEHLSPENKKILLEEMEKTTEDLLDILEAIHFYKTQEKQKSDKKKIKKIGELRFVSWDVGMGLYAFLGTRVKALADYIERERLEIICLQELNPIGADYLECRLKSEYKFVYGRKRDEPVDFDFTATLIRRDSVDFVQSKIIYFRNTGEQRSLLRTEIQIGGAKLYVLNTHNESTRENSQYRQDQFAKCFGIFQSLPAVAAVILCGSLNIRDWELKSLHKSRPRDFFDNYDLWVTCGKKDPTLRFDWDLSVNKLIQMPDKEAPNTYAPSHAQPRKRFSRIYYRLPKHQEWTIMPTSFELTGKEIVAADKYCISDHFGLLTSFKVDASCYKVASDTSNRIRQDSGESSKSIYDEEEEETVAESSEVVKDNWWDEDD